MATTKVNSEFIAVNAISGTIIADNAITATHIATNSISGTLVQDGGIVTTMIAANNVTSTKIVTDAVQTRHIADDQVTAAKLANSINTDIATGPAALPKAGGTMTGTLNITQASTADTIKLTRSTTAQNNMIKFASASADKWIVGQRNDSTEHFRFYSYGTSSDVLSIQTGGNVGIGTTSPDQLLSVKGRISSDSNDSYYGAWLDGNSAASQDNFLGLGPWHSNAGYIKFFQSASPDRLSIYTTNTGDHVTLQEDGGNVGIGTTTPAGTLHVQMTHTSTDVTAANSNETLVLGNAGTGNGVYNAIKFAGNQQDMYVMSFNNSAQASRRMGFFLGSVAGDAVADERLSILGNGNVGINRTSPNGLFHMQSSSGTDSALYIQTSATSDDSIINFGDNGSSAIGKILYEHSSDSMRFNTGGAERVRIEDDPLLLITGGTNSTTFEHLTLKSTVDNNPSRVNQVFETGQGKIAKIEGRQIAGGSNAYGELNFFTSDNGTLAEKMAIKYDGVMKLMGGITGGRQDLLFNNGSMSLANNATYTLSGILNTGALISIGVNRSNQGITYDHCLIFAETGTNAVAVANPSGRIAINSSSTDNAVNVYVSSGNVVIANFVQSTVTVSIAAFVFQGN